MALLFSNTLNLVFLPKSPLKGQEGGPYPHPPLNPRMYTSSLQSNITEGIYFVVLFTSDLFLLEVCKHENWLFGDRFGQENVGQV